jgi:hypothetical protein
MGSSFLYLITGLLKSQVSSNVTFCKFGIFKNESVSVSCIFILASFLAVISGSSISISLDSFLAVILDSSISLGSQFLAVIF